MDLALALPYTLRASCSRGSRTTSFLRVHCSCSMGSCRPDRRRLDQARTHHRIHLRSSLRMAPTPVRSDIAHTLQHHQSPDNTHPTNRWRQQPVRWQFGYSSRGSHFLFKRAVPQLGVISSLAIQAASKCDPRKVVSFDLRD